MKRVLGVPRTLRLSFGGGDRHDGPAVVLGRESFEEFFDRERRAMVAVAYAASGSRLAAEDIAQDAFLAAYRQWERVGGLNNPGTWVRRVVINRSVSAVRTRVVAARAVVRVGGRTDRVELDPVPAESEHLWAEVRRLPKRQRQVVVLRYVDQLILAEIGDVLGCSKETVNTHLRRANATLALRLGPEERE